MINLIIETIKDRPYLLTSVILSMALLARHHHQQENYRTEEIFIPYSDEISSRLRATKRSGNHIYDIVVGYQGRYYDPIYYLTEEYSELQLPEDYHTGDYFKDLHMLNRPNDCIATDKGIHCENPYIISGEYYSNKYNKLYRFLENSSKKNWWLNVGFYRGHAGIIFLWISTYIALFIYRNKGRFAYIDDQTGKIKDPAGLKAYNAHMKAQRIARRQAVKDGWKNILGR